MIETTIKNNHRYAKIADLREWDKNPREITPESLQTLENKINRLDQFKPLLITQDGVVIGGNMRLRVLKKLGYNEAWVTILEYRQSVADAKFYFSIEGVVSKTVYDSLEQALIEYALADNDQDGEVDKDKLISLVQPYKHLVPLEQYKIQEFSETVLSIIPDPDKKDEGTGPPKESNWVKCEVCGEGHYCNP